MTVTEQKAVKVTTETTEETKEVNKGPTLQELMAASKKIDENIKKDQARRQIEALQAQLKT